MKVIVIGSNGQLGTDVTSAFTNRGDCVVALTHQQIDVREIEGLKSCIHLERPDVVINTAAMHHVESCEKDPALAFAVNAIGVRNIALLSAELKFTLVHIGTDYVFDGNKGTPYTETDAPNPLNVYGNTKLSGEYFVRATAPQHFVVRVSALFGKNPCRAKGGLNFVQAMLKRAREQGTVRVVDDEYVSPTYTSDVAKQLVKLVSTDHYGLYHATSQGQCSWFQFTESIFQLTGTTANLQKAKSTDFPSKVTRPKYSVLENNKLKEHNLDIMPDWQEALKNYIKDAYL